MRDLVPENYERVDPFKMEDILERVEEITGANDFNRNGMHLMGTTINQLANLSLGMKNEAYYHHSLDKHVQ